jgi:hypothetical protein
MSESLLNALEFVRTNMPHKRKVHLEVIGRQLLKLRVEGTLVIMEAKKWGRGWVPKPFNKVVSRFPLFCLLLYSGKFEMAKEMLQNVDLPWLGLQPKTIEFKEMANTIMYNIHTLLEVFTGIVIKEQKKKLSESALTKILETQLAARGVLCNA